ncbi:competence protein ComM [Gluconobacter morbifer G707]|uniref:Competence protein ComM n=1 Tax=Gluconobacter morbifer G707 TaxID=1088869 RepID=G6XIB3_9PROT|nr:competence protein ComM [Gluconobacter morbifer G707]
MPLGRRALEIAAAGRHSLLMSGPPGAGKSMLASRLPGILPDLTTEEMLENQPHPECFRSAAGGKTDGQAVLSCPTS